MWQKWTHVSKWKLIIATCRTHNAANTRETKWCSRWQWHILCVRNHFWTSQNNVTHNWNFCRYDCGVGFIVHCRSKRINKCWTLWAITLSINDALTNDWIEKSEFAIARITFGPWPIQTTFDYFIFVEWILGAFAAFFLPINDTTVVALLHNANTREHDLSLHHFEPFFRCYFTITYV